MKLFNTMCDVGFEVIHTSADPNKIPVPELLQALAERLDRLRIADEGTVREAIGVDDTYEMPDPVAELAELKALIQESGLGIMVAGGKKSIAYRPEIEAEHNRRADEATLELMDELAEARREIEQLRAELQA